MYSVVTVIISTYNSSLFIIETLESVLIQTWMKLELIITDDCSGDETVEVCRNWLSKNHQRFTHSEIVTSGINTGVSANANRGLHAAQGHWIKFLGADDTLKPDCIEHNMLWISDHHRIKVLFSQIEVYRDTFEPANMLKIIPGDAYDPNGIMAPERDADSQYRMLLLFDRIHFSPSVFLHRDTLLSVGGFDERFKMLEDYPLWLNLTGRGYKLHFMDRVTVNYRRHSKAINNTGVPYLVNPNYFRSEGFRRLYTYPNLPADIRLNARFYWFASQLFRFSWMNRKNWATNLLLVIMTIYLNPFRYLIWIRKRLNQELKHNEFYI